MVNERYLPHGHGYHQRVVPWHMGHVGHGCFGHHFGMPAPLDPFYGGGPVHFIGDQTRDFGVDHQLSAVTDTADKFTVNLDVSQYKPDELEVTMKGNHVTVSGHHEEREDEHGVVSRSFIRRYILPEGTDADAMISYLSKDGSLTIEAPKTPGGDLRKISIVHE